MTLPVRGIYARELLKPEVYGGRAIVKQSAARRQLLSDFARLRLAAKKFRRPFPNRGKSVQVERARSACSMYRLNFNFTGYL